MRGVSAEVAMFAHQSMQYNAGDREFAAAHTTNGPLMR
jgi:hypothetical protein